MLADALDQLRHVLAAPTLKGAVAAGAMIWAAAINQATDGFLVTFGIVSTLFILDGILGVWQALAFGEFNKRDLTKFISKMLAYSGVAVCAFTAGALTDLALPGSNLAVAFTLTTGANVALAGTDALSILGHVNKLTFGKLENLPILTKLRPMLEQMRDWEPAETVRTPHAAPNGGA